MRLLQCVNEVDMIKCLVDLCKALWKIVLSYHHVVKWHHQQTSAQPSTGNLLVFLKNCK